MRETFMADNASAKAMNKSMFVMVNCGYDEVKKLCNKAFDNNLAEHIFNKYLEKCEYSGRPFFDLYFDVDSDCKRKICNYITKNYHSEGQLKEVYPTSEQRATEFAQIIDDTLALRDRYFAEAKVSVLTNGTRIGNDDVFEALKRVDNNIVKLDTVDMDYITRIDRPVGRYNLEEIIARMKAFEGRCVIQTLFMRGVDGEGVSVDNTTPQYVNPWLEAVTHIAPREVMIYTIDRETPIQGLQKASPDILDSTVAQLKERGIKASASY